MANAKRLVLTGQALEDAIKRLSAADMARLLVHAKYQSYKTGLSEEDLLSDALYRFLSGERKCPVDVNVVTFLMKAIDSIAYSERKHISNAEKHGLELLVTGEEDSESIAQYYDGPEHSLELDKLVNLIEELFSSDEEAKNFIEARINGLTKDETCQKFNITRKQYDAALKRVRRKLRATWEGK